MADRLDPEHQDLLQFLYQFPIGVIAMDERGNVTTINPAASQLLTPEVVGRESVADPLPLLRRLAPELFADLAADPDRLGMISNGRGQVVDGRDGVTRFSVTAHRLRPDHLIISLIDVTEERRILNEQRARAERLQRALLGSTDSTDLELAVSYLPAHREDLSGGDWYDVIRLGADRVALVVGDVVGHDIEASATMGQLRAIVRAFALVDDDPISVLERTDSIARSITNAACATINFAVLDPVASTVTYASAGHPPPLLLRADGTTELLTEGRRPLLAATPSSANRLDGGRAPGPRSASTRISPGDMLVLYTDGLIERRGLTLDQCFERLRATANEVRSVSSMDQFVDRLTAEMLAGTTHLDDVCVLAVRYDPSELGTSAA